MDTEDTMRAIVDTAYRVHVQIGPGVLESVYEAVLARGLERRGLTVRKQVPVPLVFDGIAFEEAFRLDLLVNESVIVELKSVEKASALHAKQVLTYLRLMDLRFGLLINFGAPTFKEGVRRIVNGYARG